MVVIQPVAVLLTQVDLVVVLKHLQVLVLQEEVQINHQQTHHHHLQLIIMDLLVVMVVHIHQKLVQVVEVVPVVLVRMDHQRLEEMVVLVDNCLQHSIIQIPHLDQMVEV